MLLVLAYPNISNGDLSWIQSVRDAHDERYANVVDPHFTLVFPVEMEPGKLIKHTKQVSSNFHGFDFALRCATVVEDDSKEYSHVFLVPDEGYSSIVKLHDRLYGGILQSQLRLDISFIPHIGIGNSVSAQTCKDLADKLNRQDFAIKGTIDQLDVVSYADNTVTTIEQITLPSVPR